MVVAWVGVPVAVVLAVAMGTEIASATQPRSWESGFESGAPSWVRTENAVVVRDPAWVVSGAASLVCDTRRTGKEWNEFLRTDPEQLPLAPGHIYRISFDYRAIDPGDNTYYCLLRSLRQPEGGSLDQMTEFQLETVSWSRPLQVVDIVRYSGRYLREFQIPYAVPDYYLIVGIQNKALLAVDDLRIEDLGTAGDVKVGKIKSGFSPPYQRELDELMAYKARWAPSERLGHVRLAVKDEGVDPGLLDRLQQELGPDYYSWWGKGATGGRYGVRCSRGGAEYNGYYRAEAPAYWDNRFEFFRGHGFIESLDDTCQQDKYWGEGGYQTCQNGDRWHHLQQLSMLQWLPQYDDICQDNLTWAAFYMNGCYCACCQQQFRDYLIGKYTPEQLARLGRGIPDIDTFDMRSYLCDTLGRPTGFAVVKDPVVREYIKFQNIAHFRAWLDHCLAFKQVGEQQNRGIAMYGNQNAIDYVANAAAISPLCDAVEVECMDTENSYLIARGSGLDQKPVWTRGAPRQKPFGLGLTFGGFRNLQWWWKRESSDPEEVIETSRAFPIYKSYADFMSRNRALFGPQRGYTRIALIWSLPSLMWRCYPPQDLRPMGQRSEFAALSQLMIDQNIMFDCVVFQHPEIYNDREFLARLMEYDIVILPNVDCLSSAQADALRRMSRMGKQILVVGSFGVRDEDFNRADRASGIRFIRVAPDAGLTRRLQAANPIRVSAAAVEGKIARITATVFRRLQGRLLVANFLNRDTDDRMFDAPWSGRVTVKIRIPDGLAYDTVFATSWEHGPIELSPSPADPPADSGGGDWIEVEVPRVQHYTAVAIGARAEIERANAAELAWIEADRVQAKRDFAARQAYYAAHGWPETVMPQ
jgi:hypothetical protein